MILFDHYDGNVAIVQMNFFEKLNLRSPEESTFLVESTWTMHHDMHNFDDKRSFSNYFYPLYLDVLYCYPVIKLI